MTRSIDMFATTDTADQNILVGYRLTQPGHTSFIRYAKVSLESRGDEHNKARAELITLQHILLHCDLFDYAELPRTNITVSTGQCKKGIQNRSGKEQINRLGGSLRMVIDTSKILVRNQAPAWFKESTMSSNQLSMSGLYFNTHLPATCALGSIRISSNVLDRFKALSKDRPTNPLKSLNRLLNSSLIRANLPDHVVKHKRRLYGASEYWSVPNSDWIFIFATDKKEPVLVTCYKAEGNR
ncbi:hypothetical protein VTH8203_01354 [Vibrio thalassae]|uniref:Uncharacterized protein n=1 Tax=Vibrio thalassae TaxID=1243014 RepID=A0A240EHS5_9VIBR|nr:hypothetical protein [Vibrio thalassae]SNX47739.1 hypothetical protein VTH8203_01354 [Vibrio thalassae]